MDIEFSELPWHDAVLLNIVIDRRNPEKNDQVIVDIQWPNGRKNSLVFSDCYRVDASMNFGIIASDSILDASLIDQSLDLSKIKEKWMQIGVDLKTLKCFEIETNSTGSLLHIYSLGYSLR